MKIKNVKLIEEMDWNKLVQKTYQRPYDFQQQDGCKNRGTFNLCVPCPDAEDFDNDTVPEVVNGDEMGVSFAAWQARDPKQKLSNPGDQDDFSLDLWWGRNFYPNVDMVANDLHARGLLPAGDYLINIDW